MPSTTRKRKRDESETVPGATSGMPINKPRKKSVVVTPGNKRTLKLGKQKQKPISPVRKLSARESRQNVLDDTVLMSVTSSDEDRFELNEESELNVSSDVLTGRSRSDIRREELERELRLLSLEEEVANLRSLKPKSSNKETVPISGTSETLENVERQFRVAVPTGNNNLGTFNGKTDLETFFISFSKLC